MNKGSGSRLPSQAPAGERLVVEEGVCLQDMNTFAIAATAARLVRVREARDAAAIARDPVLGPAPKLILGGGSNLLLTRDPAPLVVKVEIAGMRVLTSTPKATVLEAGAGVRWHEFVRWSLAQGHPGLENLALIPGTVGAAPVQNIGAYGLEVAQRIESVVATDLSSGQAVEFDAEACRFGYRDSVFKREWAGRCLITHVRFRLPRPWRAVLGYADLDRHFSRAGLAHPDAQQIFEAVCAIRKAKLPDPAEVGNAGSFFKNPIVEAAARDELGQAFPGLVSYPQDDGRHKLAAAWMIESCGWKGRNLGRAGIHARHALVLVNLGGAAGAEIIALAENVRADVLAKFGVRLEYEPVVVG
ncbi:MAG: UDP-N-acetylmuramate dehydrogenase [Betaproteobacteria bacterium]|nr:UDP-N-acetylmuramate dehydrogenase [Betaproteobacteria bacterium]